MLTVKDVISTKETLIGDSTAVEKTSLSVKPVIFKNFTGHWSQNAQKPCLSNINLTLNPGSVTAVIGKIGSGKSSLLLAFLKEIPLTTGILTNSGRMAYVEQDPIIFSGTFRENVLVWKKL